MKIILFRIYQFLKFRKNKYPINPNRILKELKHSQYWTREKIERFQLERINKLIIDAKNHSKFYASKFKKLSLPLASITEFKDKVPHISKDDIIKAQELLNSKYFLENHKHSTSGSSGDPLSVYISSSAEAYRKAGGLRFRDWWGIKPYDKSVLIWRYENRTKGSLIERLKKIFKFRYEINVFNLSDENIKGHFDYIEKFQPTYLRGYTSGVLEFARLLEQNKLTFKKTKLKVVIVTAENLFDQDRNYIERVLKCKVANEFGSAEAGLFAYECPSGSMHIYEEANLIYSDEDSSAYMTEFFNDSMPLINYKNDDKIIISDVQCECGRTLRIIKDLIGRESGYIKRPDGTKLNHGILIVIFIEMQEEGFSEAIKKFKVIQKGNNFDVYIVPMKNYNEKTEKYVKEKMYSIIGKEINIKIHRTDKIEREKSGKLRYFIRIDD